MLTPKEIREELIKRGYDLTQHSNPLSAIHGIVRSIRITKSKPKGSLSNIIREILREAGEL